MRLSSLCLSVFNIPFIHFSPDFTSTLLQITTCREHFKMTEKPKFGKERERTTHVTCLPSPYPGLKAPTSSPALELTV